MHALVTGFITGLSLIVAIGSQNAFVLRQGLRRAHVLPIVLICVLSDAILICVGVFASAWIATAMPLVLPVMKWGGVVFLTVYGALALRSAWRGGHYLTPADGVSQSMFAAISTCLMLTWLNPHVYLDTVVLLGAISTKFGTSSGLFALGAVAGSTAFFFALGCGARFLAPLFAKDISWRILDAAICIIMWLIAIRLSLNA